jgi:hypothetical protein
MGVQLFGGKFYKCVYVDTHDRVNISENVTNKMDCLSKHFTWENSRVNFDNVVNGYLALFQVVSSLIQLMRFTTLVRRMRFCLEYNDEQSGSPAG